MEELVSLLPILLPIILIEAGLRIYAIVDIIKVDRKVKGDNKIIWLLVIALVSLGWLLYFLIGRED